VAWHAFAMQQADVTVALTETDAVRRELDAYGISRRVGPSYVFETVQAAVEAFGAAEPGQPALRAAPAA
jgi:hypothetical protein